MPLNAHIYTLSQPTPHSYRIARLDMNASTGDLTVQTSDGQTAQFPVAGLVGYKIDDWPETRQLTLALPSGVTPLKVRSDGPGKKEVMGEVEWLVFGRSDGLEPVARFRKQVVHSDLPMMR